MKEKKENLYTNLNFRNNNFQINKTKFFQSTTVLPRVLSRVLSRVFVTIFRSPKSLATGFSLALKRALKRAPNGTLTETPKRSSKWATKWALTSVSTLGFASFFALFFMAMLNLGCEIRSVDSSDQDTAKTTNTAVPDPGPGDNPKPDQPEPKAATVLENKIQFRPLEQAHKYEVQIQFKSELSSLLKQSPQAIQVLRRDVNQKVFVEIPYIESGLVDRSVVENTTYEYKISAIIQGQLQEQALLQVSIPLDMEVEGNHRLEASLSGKELKLGRLFLNDQSTLYTLGQNLKISATQIISEEGRIFGFSDSDKLAAKLTKTEILPSGMIEISADELVGSLEFNLDGLSGADGANGAAPDEGLRGHNGDPGLVYDVPGLFWKGCEELQTVYVGQKGGDGAIGYSGQNGINGGNTLGLKFTVKSGSQNVKILSRRPGMGGIGGSGAAGGQGGLGGAGLVIRGLQFGNLPKMIKYFYGSYFLVEGGIDNPPAKRVELHAIIEKGDKDCIEKSQAGQPGQTGPRGRDGQNGAMGGVTPVCINGSCF